MRKITEQEAKKLESGIELYQRKKRVDIVLFACMAVFIAAAIVLIVIILGNEAHNRIEYRNHLSSIFFAKLLQL